MCEVSVCLSSACEGKLLLANFVLLSCRPKFMCFSGPSDLSGGSGARVPSYLVADRGGAKSLWFVGVYSGGRRALVFFDDGENTGRIRFLHSDFNGNDGGGDDVNKSFEKASWRLTFSDGDGETETLLPPWNKFLWPFFGLIVVRSDRDEGVERLGSVSFLLRWHKEEEERHKKEENDVDRFYLQGCWPLFIGLLFSACLLSVRLCGLLYDFSYRFGIEMREYNEDEQYWIL